MVTGEGWAHCFASVAAIPLVFVQYFFVLRPLNIHWSNYGPVWAVAQSVAMMTLPWQHANYRKSSHNKSSLFFTIFKHIIIAYTI